MGKRSKLPAASSRTSKRRKPNETRCVFAAKYSIAWQKILPKLPLDDLVSLAKVGPLLQPLIADNLADVTIDEEFVDNHPIPENPDFYKTLGSLAKKLIVSSVPRGKDISAILNYFKNVQSLTLIDIMRPMAECNYPRSLTSLTLINCVLPYETMSRWLTALASTLESLHFDRCPFNDRPWLSTMVELPKLRHVVMKGEDMENDFWDFTEITPIETLELHLKESPPPEWIQFPSLKSLVIRVETLLDLQCHSDEVMFSLEHYSLEVTKWKEQFFSLTKSYTETFLETSEQTLRSLCLPGCPDETAWLKKFVNLQELTINAPLETEEEEERLMALAFQLLYPKLKINYYSDPSPTFNQILRLDENSLVDIFSLLDRRDLLYLLPVHPRFKVPVQRAAKKVWKKQVVHPTWGADLSTLGHYITVYGAIGGEIDHLDIKGTTEEDFWRIVKCFPNTKSLILTTDLKNKKDIKKFPLLTKLTVKNKEITAPYLRVLFKHLNPSLTHLVFEQKALNSVKVLTNLQSLGIRYSAISNQLNAALIKNPRCTELTVDVDEDEGYGNKEWRRLASFNQVKRLIVHNCEPYIRRGTICSFKHLEEFECTALQGSYGRGLDFLLPLLGPQLKRLRIWDLSEDFEPVYDIRTDLLEALNGLPNLEELHTKCEFMFGNWQSVRLRPNLKKLTAAVNREEDIIMFIKKLPKLEEFNTLFDVKEDVLMKVEAALGTKRTLQFNGVSLPTRA